MGNCCKKCLVILKKNRNESHELFDSYNMTNMDDEWISVLKSSTTENIPDFSFCGICALCKVVDVYDADTFRVVFFRNKEDKELMKVKVRAAGCNAAEIYPLKTHPNRKEEMRKARLARNRLLELVTDVKVDTQNINYKKDDIENMLSENKKLVYIKFGKFDKYGRVLGTLYSNENEETSINQLLISENHAVAYSGGKRNKNKLTVGE